MATLWPVASIFATGIADLFIQVTRFGALMLDPLLRTRGETLGVTMVNLGWFGIVQYCHIWKQLPSGKHTKSYGKSPFL